MPPKGMCGRLRAKGGAIELSSPQKKKHQVQNVHRILPKVQKAEEFNC
jgi:hypothetical protein